MCWGVAGVHVRRVHGHAWPHGVQRHAVSRVLGHRTVRTRSQLMTSQGEAVEQTSSKPAVQRAARSVRDTAAERAVAGSHKARHGTMQDKKAKGTSKPPSQKIQSSTPLNAYMLTELITATTTVEQLADILQQHGSNMNSINLSAFMIQLARLAALAKHAQAGHDKRDARNTPRHEPARDLEAEGMEVDDATEAWLDDERLSQRRASSNGVGSRAESISDANIGKQHIRQHGGRSGQGPGRKAQAQVRTLAQQAMRLLQPNILELDSRGLVNVLYSLAQLRLRHVMIDDLLYVSIPFLPELTPQGLSNIMYSIAVLGVRPQREWLSAFFRHSLEQLRSMDGQQLSNIMWGLAKLKLAPGVATGSRDWETAMYAAVRGAAQQQRLSSQSISNLAWSMASLHLFPPKDMVASLRDAACPRLDEFTPQGISNLMWGMARMRCELPAAWINQFMVDTYDKLPSYSPVVLCTLLYSLALLGHSPASTQIPVSAQQATGLKVSQQELNRPARPSPSPPTKAAATASSAPSHQLPKSSQSANASRAWMQRMQELLREALPESDPHTTANVMYSFGKLGVAPEHALLQAVLARIYDQLSEFSPQGLANCIWAVAKLGVAPGPRWMGAFMEESFVKMPLMNPQELSNMLWALARLRHRPDTMWIARMDRESEDKLHEYAPQNLSNTVHALATFRYAPSADWQQAFVKQLGIKLPQMSVVQVADTIWAVAELGLPIAPAVLNRLVAGATADITSVASTELVSVLGAMLKLGVAPKRQWLELLASDLETQMSNMALATLADAAWALAAVGYAPHVAWVHKLDARVVVVLQHQQQQAAGSTGTSSAVPVTPEVLCRLVTARSRLYTPERVPWLSVLGHKLLQPSVLRVLPAAQLLPAMGALATLGYESQELLLAQFTEQAAAAIGLSKDSTRQLRKAA